MREQDGRSWRTFSRYPRRRLIRLALAMGCWCATLGRISGGAGGVDCLDLVEPIWRAARGLSGGGGGGDGDQTFARQGKRLGLMTFCRLGTPRRAVQEEAVLGGGRG